MDGKLCEINAAHGKLVWKTFCHNSSVLQRFVKLILLKLIHEKKSLK